MANRKQVLLGDVIAAAVQIRKSDRARDYETAHGDEDTIRENVLHTIATASGMTLKMARKLARAALGTNPKKNPRW